MTGTKRQQEKATVSSKTAKVESSELLKQCESLVPKLKEANAQLDAEVEEDPSVLEKYNIENVEDDEQVIEMNIGVGVLEEKKGRKASKKDDDEEDDEEEDNEEEEEEELDLKLPGQKDTKKKLVEEVDQDEEEVDEEDVSEYSEEEDEEEEEDDDEYSE